MDIELVLENTKLRGTLDDTAAGRDFASLLPLTLTLTLTLTDFHSPKRSASCRGVCPPRAHLPGPQRRPATSPTTRPGATSPSFTATSPTDGPVRLSCLDPGAADVLAGLDDDTTVSIGATE